ncbi:class I SAM-dependent methyltransferase [Candidatus Lucifugimonas marina]|jgi:ubiquinone/menaquinone biosynthesis C-methylase UbiE|uniref:Methyltransferase domain-containing protein n=1 Tax=Candidatus Lucifugimonas marina TaxID=3038979 RepID=A0AAJ5ZJV1_9CHLR|nr:methyltransferase domain-containing protein [SAR202 cluster bacterium JH702]MDG0870306.1 methyltransferase domain-containing protein [SAR202 cluster bacterium JH639]WFG36135.1 methyltransferase domain-containing protein [SAR202 cluster bacterium JH545]WFG40081.1 methyltransferase domain-containing protein [SAR202 cluster bacterium JH1073]
MPTKTSVDKVEALLNPTLEETYDPQSMIALVPIHNDQKVADIGSGPGWLSIPLAKYVYAGTCYAIDVQEEMLKHVKEQGEAAKLGNIETLVSKENSIPLDDESLDGVALSDVLHETSKPKTLIKEAARLLKKSGWISIVEWLPVEGKAKVGPAASKRVVQQEMREAVEALGFTTLTSRQLTPHRYIIVARK